MAIVDRFIAEVDVDARVLHKKNVFTIVPIPLFINSGFIETRPFIPPWARTWTLLLELSKIAAFLVVLNLKARDPDRLGQISIDGNGDSANVYHKSWLFVHIKNLEAVACLYR